MYHVFARRFRPQTFRSVLGQDPLVTTLKNSIRSGRLAHAYLFSGPRGTGKTSIARLFAKALNCQQRTPEMEPCNACSSCQHIAESNSLDVLEIDGASHRGIDDIRTISESVSYAPTSGRYKIYLIDEVHMLTKEAFNALLKTLEEPPEHVKFFFATTEPHKVPLTIVSRCQRFQLKRLSPSSIVKKLQLIAEAEALSLSEAALLKIAQYADGGLRDAESMLDQIVAFSDGSISEATVEEVLGLSPQEWFSHIDSAIDTVCYDTAFRIIDALLSEGRDIGYFIQDLSSHYKKLLRNQKAPSLTKEELVHILELIAKAHVALKAAPSPRIILDWLLTSIVQIRLKAPLTTIVKKLYEIEERFGSDSTFTTTAADDHQIPAIPPSAPPTKNEKKLPSETAEQEKSRQESVMHIAALELEGILTKKGARP